MITRSMSFSNRHGAYRGNGRGDDSPIQTGRRNFWLPLFSHSRKKSSDPPACALQQSVIPIHVTIRLLCVWDDIDFFFLLLSLSLFSIPTRYFPPTASLLSSLRSAIHNIAGPYDTLILSFSICNCPSSSTSSTLHL